MENQFTFGDQCGKDYEWWVEATAQAEPKTVNRSSPHENETLGHTKAKWERLVKVITSKQMPHSPSKRPLVHSHIFLVIVFCSHISVSWREAKIMTLSKV